MTWREALRYLILSDIHSNLDALEKCMDLAKGKYEEVLCLGDLVGYGPDPNEVVDRVRSLVRIIIRGNHDKACCGITDAEDFNPLARFATMWTRQALTPANIAFLRDLPAGPLRMNGFEMVHGSPLDEDEYIISPAEALPAFTSTADTVLFGHTHYQGGFILKSGNHLQTIQALSPDPGCTLVLPLEQGARYLINPGSIGQPRDGDWRAAFAIFDETQRAVEYYRTPYDLSKTQQRMYKAGLPDPLIKRLEFGR